jgi:hypothetical protein
VDMPRDSSGDRAQRLNDPSGCCHTDDMIVMNIDWGDIATWVTGWFTAGSLLLGFSILRSDKKKEERTEAAGVHVRLKGHFDAKDKTRSHGVRIVIENRSTTPMFDVRVCAQPRSAKQMERMSITPAQLDAIFDVDVKDTAKATKFESGYLEENDNGILEPGTNAAGILKLPFDSVFYDLRVEFSDVNAIRWIRKPDSWELIRYPRFKRWSRQ